MNVNVHMLDGQFVTFSSAKCFAYRLGFTVEYRNGAIRASDGNNNFVLRNDESEGICWWAIG